jgi:plastocyanin
MRSRARIALLAAPFLGLPLAALPMPGHAAERDKTAMCIEAAELYRERTGRVLADESPPVIVMYKTAFCPVTITAKAGTKLRFVNLDRRTSHSWWFKAAGQPESERLFGGESAETVLDLPAGEHEYLCGPHWQADHMIGRIVVTP